MVNRYDIIKVQSDEDKNHHDCHDVILHGFNVYPFYVVSARFSPGRFYLFLHKILDTASAFCDIIIVEIEKVVYTRFLSFEFSKRCAAE